LLTLSYEFTTGWWAPLAAYIIFALGVIVLVRRMQVVIERELLSVATDDPKQRRSNNLQCLCGKWGLVLGMATGFAGLLVGLINSGRLVL